MTRSTLQAAVQAIEHTWIPLSDGCRLAARIWIPSDAKRQPVPAILEYIPYRKRDFKAVRDSEIYRFFAQHGYAGVRVDLRGSGDSEGVLCDEYLPQELEDGLEVLAWIARQPWCTGDIGMMGLSWGGFNGLQLAALAPPELKAIITVCSSDNRYVDDVHYMGGCLLTDNLSWASTMFAYNSCPPDPAVVGEHWRKMWLERLDGSGLWLKQWLQHQVRDAYWRHGSVCEDFSAIQCPVLAVSGWADGYSNTVFRLLENLRVPRRGLIGPWGHKYPHMGGPGPEIDFLREALRWWDQWLRGRDTGVRDEPMLRAWMQDTASPIVAERPGRWVGASVWPASDISTLSFGLSPAGLVADEGQLASVAELNIQSPLSVGLFAGKWCSYAEDTDLPSDQREEDGGALVFDSAPLNSDLEILGFVQVELEFSCNKPVAMVAVRLSDVAPDGHATRVTYGLLNLTHLKSHEAPQSLDLGRRYRVPIPLNGVAQRFRAGHQIRLSVSTSYWPLAWPAPEPARLTIYCSGCRLHLPVRPPNPEDAQLRDLGRPVCGEADPTTLIVPARREWTVTHNLAMNEVTLSVINNDPRYRLDDIDLEIQKDVKENYTYRANNYSTVRGEVVSKRGFRRKDWAVTTLTRTVLTSTRTHFHILATLDAYEGDARTFAKSWDEMIPRQLV